MTLECDFLPKYHTYLRNKFNNNKQSRLKSILLLSLVFISIITTLPILNSTNAGAATNTYSANRSDQDWIIKSILYYKTISKCFTTTLSSGGLVGDYITYNDAKNYKWFGGGAFGGLLNIGVYMKDSTIQNGEYGNIIKSANWDGNVHCNNGYLVKDALAFWGLDPITVLCESGFSRDKNGTKDNIGTVASCESATDNEQAALNFKTNSNVFTKFTSYIKKTIYGDDKTEPSLDIAGTTTPDKQEQAARWYRFYRHSLNESCIPNIDSVPPDTNGGLSGPKIYSDVIWVNKDTGEITKGTYTGAYSASESASIGPIQAGQFDTGGDLTMKCSDMVKEMNKNADLYSAWVKAYVNAHNTYPPAPQTAVINTPGTTTTSSCAVGGIGWIVCPVINFLAGIADTAFNFLADNFLSVNTSLLNTDPNATTTDSSGNQVTVGTGAYSAWQMMRSFANVVLVIVFLVIIFSQLSSVGITNYGIKKLLPKLVLVAVLINVSFFICQISVDLSNILGYNLKSLLTNLAGSAVNVPDAAKLATASATGSGWSGIAGTVLAGGTAAGLGVASAGGITLAFVALVGMLLAAVIALLMIFFIFSRTPDARRFVGCHGTTCLCSLFATKHQELV